MLTSSVNATARSTASTSAMAGPTRRPAAGRLAGNSRPGHRPRRAPSRRRRARANLNSAPGLRPCVAAERVGDFCYRWYETGTGRYASADPLGLRDGPNQFHYAHANATGHIDPLGLEVLVCSRTAYLPLVGEFLNHSYFWDTRDGLKPDQHSCARGDFSALESGPPTDECSPIPGSAGREEDLMSCCRLTRQVEPFMPIFNDCHASLAACVEALGFQETPAPGGRVAPPCNRCSPVTPPFER
jgi:hypothetical protein